MFRWDSLMPNRRRRILGFVAAGVAGGAAAYWAYSWWVQQDSSTEEREEDDPAASSSSNVSVLQTDGNDVPSVHEPSSTHGLSERDALSHLQYHFTSIQEIAETTTLPSLIGPLARKIETSDGMDDKLCILKEVKIGSRKMGVEEKMELWKSVGEDSLAQALAAIWLVPMLNLQIRVQLNVLGRNLYLSSVLTDSQYLSRDIYKPEMMNNAQGVPMPSHLSAASQEAFLSFAEFLGKEGCVTLIAKTREIAKQVVSNVALNQIFDDHAWKNLLSTCLESMSAWMDSLNVVDMLLPPPHEVRHILGLDHPDDIAVMQNSGKSMIDAETVEFMLRETKAVMTTQSFVGLLKQCAAEIAYLVSQFVGEKIPEKGVPYVKIIPIISNEAKRIMLPKDEYSVALAKLKSVAQMSAAVYSCPGGSDLHV